MRNTHDDLVQLRQAIGTNHRRPGAKIKAKDKRKKNNVVFIRRLVDNDNFLYLIKVAPSTYVDFSACKKRRQATIGSKLTQACAITSAIKMQRNYVSHAFNVSSDFIVENRYVITVPNML